jgi:hypothetical protein
MRTARRLLAVAFLFLLPGTLSAQYMRSDLPPQQKGYPAPFDPFVFSVQRIYLSPNELMRVQELARFRQGQRDAFDRIYDQNESVRDVYLSNLRVGDDWERPVTVTVAPVEPAPTPQRHELRPVIRERRELRSMQSEYERRFQDLRDTDPAVRAELDRRWEEFQREIRERRDTDSTPRR